MVPKLRKAFNEQFSQETYQAYLEKLDSYYPGTIEFRVVETPVFVDAAFTGKMLDTCDYIIDQMKAPGFMEQTKGAIPAGEQVPNETSYPDCIAFDFGACEGENGLEPQLIEMQGFPSLFAYQVLHSEVTEQFFARPVGYTDYFSNLDESSYISLLKEVILGGLPQENVVLLEIYPEQQKTRVDFYCTKRYLGIETVCLTKLQGREDGTLFYEKNGREIDIKRIYNRVIFDDLKKFELPKETIDLQYPWKVEWCPHPSWFYRLSKYTLPFLDHPNIPATRFLNQIKEIPSDLENYVLKPLFSFAGQGVVIDVSPEDIAAVKDPENWILQKKVKYADAIQTPDIPAKLEIRLFYLWPKGAPQPIPAQSLTRLSKGKMIGVRYNMDKTWVGGGLGWFQQSGPDL